MQRGSERRTNGSESKAALTLMSEKSDPKIVFDKYRGAVKGEEWTERGSSV